MIAEYKETRRKRRETKEQFRMENKMEKVEEKSTGTRLFACVRI